MTRFRRRSERGATMLELAIVLPLLTVLAFGTAEMGLAWVANNRVESAVSTAARTAASSGNLAEADRSVLQSLQVSLTAEQLATLDRVIIFKPTTTGGGVPAGCIKPVGSTSQVGVNNQCNTYTGATVRTNPAGVVGVSDQSWKPTTRKVHLVDPPDYIGVWIRTSYRSKTGTFFNDMTITKVSVYRLQPDTDG
jgi:Flp pilus assembly protein TadG